MGTAIEPILGFHAVTDDSAPAMGARHCQRVDRAFEAIEGVGLTLHDHVEGLVVAVAADFAFTHIVLLEIPFVAAPTPLLGERRAEA
jgi:hypothetical protein